VRVAPTRSNDVGLTTAIGQAASVSLLRVLAAMIGLRGLTVPDDLSVVLLVDYEPDLATHSPGDRRARTG
jgi:hypothetical protein